MIRQLKRSRHFPRYIPQLEVLEDRNCPAVITDTTGTAVLDQDPSRINVVAQSTLASTPTDARQGDVTQFAPTGDLGSENLTTTVANAIAQRENENGFGTPDSVRRFLLQIDPMTPVPAMPLDVQSAAGAVPTSNVANVGTNTVLRATANRVGGSRTVDGLPDVVLPWLGISGAGPNATPAATTPGGTRPDTRPSEPTEPRNPEEGGHAPPPNEADNSPLTIGLVFGGFKRPESLSASEATAFAHLGLVA